MAARISSPDEAAAIVEREYSDEYFAGLEKQFGIDFGPDNRREFRTIGRRYLTMRGIGNDGKSRREDRAHYTRLAKQTGTFLEILRHTPREDIEFGIYMAALRQNEPIPTTKFPHLSKHAQSQTGAPYFRELIRLLKLLKSAADRFADDCRERPGPKINRGLELLVRRSADYFISRLNRPFSVDHHKPIAPSEAFDFVSALVAPLDNISDTEIITAIRAEQNKRRNMSQKTR